MDRKRIAARLGVPEVLTSEGRHRLRRDEVAANPQLLWNAFVDILSRGPDAFAQGPDYFAHGPRRCAALAFLYDSAVQKGGHQEYFRNKRRKYKYAPETITALRRLGDHCHADVLAAAYNRFIAEDDEYPVEGSVFDDAFHRCAPPLIKVLEAHLLENEAEYIEWDNDLQSKV